MGRINLNKVKEKDVDLEKSKEDIDSYLVQFESSDEERNRLKQLIESIKPIESEALIEEELNKSNTNNTNGIISKLISYQKQEKELNQLLTDAKTNKTNAKTESNELSETLSYMLTTIQQEKDFKSICGLYQDLTGNKFASEPKSSVYLTLENDEKVLITIEEMEYSVEALRYFLHIEELKIQLIDRFLPVIEEKHKVVKHNHFLVETYGLDKKFIHKTDGDVDLTVQSKHKNGRNEDIDTNPKNAINGRKNENEIQEKSGTAVSTGSKIYNYFFSSKQEQQKQNK